MNLLPILLLWGSAASNCQAAFVPPSSRKTAGPRIVTTTVTTTTTSLYLDNLPKSLSDMEINLPDNIKDTIAKIPKPPLPGTTATVGGTNKLTPTPPLPFDPTNPEALISITKAFIASDFGIQSSQLRDYSTAPKSKTDTEGDITSTTGLPFYSSSLLLSPNNFVWVSGNNLNDGRTGLLTKDEYLAAGRYFDLRKSFPDLEYRAHDFRVIYDEESSEYGSENREGAGAGEITVRFTTRTTGTFRGAPLKLRSMVLEPNGKVMKCPPTSISITYSTRGEDRGKIIKLVTDQVLDRQVCNTNGLSGIPAAAVIGGASTNALLDVVGGSVPPLVALGRVFGRPLKPIVDNTSGGGDGASNLAPFPDSVLIQLAKGVIASNFGLNDPNLLAETFMYLEPLMGPLDKDKYLQVFTKEYDVRCGVPDLDYDLQNFRVDPYDPYRVWVDSRPKGTRVGSIGMRALPSGVTAAVYKAPPEGISFTFDDDGFCTRLTSAAVMDPLLGNTGGLGGVYGLLYATLTPASALKTRSLNGFFSRASKSLLKGVTGMGADGFKMSDGRVVNTLPGGSSSISLPSSASPTKATATSSLLKPQPPAEMAPPNKPFFAADAAASTPQRPTIVLPKINAKAKAPVKPPVQPAPKKQQPAATRTISTAKKAATMDASPADPVTEAFNNAFGIGTPGSIKQEDTPPPSKKESSFTSSKALELRNAAAAARAEAAEAKKQAAAKKANEVAARQAALDAKLEQQKQAGLLRMEREEKLAQQAAEAKRQAAAKKAEEAAAKQAALDAKLEKQRQAGQLRKEREEQLAQQAAKKKKELKENTKMKMAAKKSSSASTRSGEKSVPSSTGGSAGMFSFFVSKDAGLKKPTASPETKEKPSSKGKSTPAQRSPTISLFGTSKKSTKKPTASPKTKEKPSPKGKSTPAQRSPTISLFGTSKKSTKKQSTGVKKMPPSKKPVAAKKKGTTSSTPLKRSPTISLFGSATSPKKTATTIKSTKSKSATFTIPTKKSTKQPPKKQSLTASTPPKEKASLFNMSWKQGPKKKEASTSPGKTSAAIKRSPTISLFTQSSPSKKQPPTPKPKQVAPKPASATKSSPSFSLFGGFGGSKSEEEKPNALATGKNNKQAVAPRGVPTLKQWKRVNGNAIEGLIFGSKSFKDGVTVTTSPIAMRKGMTFTEGIVVQTQSGSKYFLG